MTVFPKPASTVVLMDDLSRVYLTKRPVTMKFMGGFYVFPGGAVEKGDHEIETGCFKGKCCNESVELSYYVAAARELFEEAGILLCGAADGVPVQLKEDIAAKYRSLLMEGKITFLHMLINEGLYLYLESLNYFGQIITPKMSPIRFDTRFFLARLPAGQQPKPDSKEVADACWMSPYDALAAYENGKISLAPPTIHTLKTIIEYLKGRPLNMPEFKLSDYRLSF